MSHPVPSGLQGIVLSCGSPIEAFIGPIMGDIERGEANLSLCIIDKIARGLSLPMAKL